MPHSKPGQRDGRTVTPRQILCSFDGVRRIPGGIFLDATYCKDGGNTSYTQELRAGVVLGQLPSGMWAPCKRTSLAAGNSGSGSGVSITTLNVVNAAHFQVGDIISIPCTNGRVAKTISAIDYDTNLITFSVALTNNLVTGGGTDGISDHVIIHSDDTAQTGVSIARAILGEHVDLISHDDNTARDMSAAEVYIAGVVDEDLVLGDLAAIRAADNQTDGHLRAIIWADRQGF
jgi:hypothetical protein